MVRKSLTPQKFAPIIHEVKILQQPKFNHELLKRITKVQRNTRLRYNLHYTRQPPWHLHRHRMEFHETAIKKEAESGGAHDHLTGDSKGLLGIRLKQLRSDSEGSKHPP